MLVSSLHADSTMLIDDFSSYKDTKDFLHTWKSRSSDYKKTLKENSYYYYLRPDPFDPGKNCVCSALREYPTNYVRTDIPADDIKMVVGTEGKVKSVNIYKDYWLKKIKLYNYHKKGEEAFLEWDWLAYKLPYGALDEVKGQDDHAIAIYAVLYTGWLEFKTIKYVWSATSNMGMIPPEQTTDEDKRVYIVSNNKNPMGKWVHVSVNLSEAIKEFLPDDYDNISIAAISMMADSDDAKKPSQACVKDIKITFKSAKQK